jgi:hypothetical protein
VSTIIQVGPGKAHTVITGADGSREVVSWNLKGHSVPAIRQVRSTLVRFPVAYYQHANYGPEVMAARSENIARLGWSSESFDLPLPPESVGHFNLLSKAIKAAHRDLSTSPTTVSVGFPTTLKLSAADAWRPRFVVYLNLAAYEFYHLLFAACGRYSHLQFNVPGIAVGTCPKLIAWLAKFERDKAQQYRENGFDWNPNCGMDRPDGEGRGAGRA